MERLTKSINGMVWFASQDHEGLWLEPCEMSYHDNRIVVDKLAAYEDTGFTPEQIAVFPYRKEFAYADYMKELFPKMERAEELSAADKEGRLAVLPCKVGDMAYYFRGTTIYGDTVDRIVIDGLDNQIVLNANRAYLFCDVGSKLFFSYAEAEAALKKRKEE